MTAVCVGQSRTKPPLTKAQQSLLARTVPMHLALTQEPEFVAGGVDTTWFARFLQRREATAPVVAGQ